MKYKLIASDYDMTLTTVLRQITDRTKKAVKDFQDEGGVFTICTARPYDAIKDLKDKIHVTAMILNQGASIYDPNTDECIYQHLLTKEETNEITTYFNQFTSRIFLLNDSAAFCKHRTYLEMQCDKLFKHKVKALGKKITTYYPEKGVTQVMIWGTESKINKLLEQSKEYFGDKYELGLCDKNMLNVTAKGVTKGSGIRYLQEYYGFTKEESIAFGDSDNDAAMYESVAVGVAMGNAMEGLKKAADVVCDSCEEDGLAKYIEENILDK